MKSIDEVLWADFNNIFLFFIVILLAELLTKCFCLKPVNLQKFLSYSMLW